MRTDYVGSRSFAEPAAEQIADALRRAAYRPSITEQVCGDPRPGQSALDQKRDQERQAFAKLFLP